MVMATTVGADDGDDDGDDDFDYDALIGFRDRKLTLRSKVDVGL